MAPSDPARRAKARAAAREPGRWGADAPGTEAEARERLLAVATQCYLARGMLRTTMEDIARAANIHRTTVYSYFRNRDELLEGVLLRALRPIAAETEQVMSGPGTFVERLTQALSITSRAIAHTPFLALLYNTENVAFTLRAAHASALLRERTHQALTRHVQTAVAAGELRADVSAATITSWLMRVNELLLSDPLEEFGPEGHVTAMRLFVAPSIVAR